MGKAAPPKAEGCCCKAKAHSGTPSPTHAGSADPDARTGSPRSCPNNCTSPCSLGKPTCEVSSHAVVDLFEVRPVGVTAVLMAQRPCPPTLDGLLRPPRA